MEHGDGTAAVGVVEPLWCVAGEARPHAKTNPLAEMELPRKRRPLPRVVDWEILAAAVRAESKSRDAAILGVLVYAGLRRGEVVGLSVGDFAMAATLHVLGKGNKDRVISLPKPAQDEYLGTRWFNCVWNPRSRLGDAAVLSIEAT